MIQYILGFAKSGKSDFAEKFIANIGGSTIYIGTLPNDPYYFHEIKVHQQRRPISWNLIELIGDLELDFENLKKILPFYDNILFDGLSFYLFRLLSLFNENNNINDDLDLIKSFFSWTAKQKFNIFIVDPPVSNLLPEVIYKFLLDVHIEILEKSDKIIYVEKGNYSLISKNRAIEIDLNNTGFMVDSRVNYIVNSSDN